MTLALLIATGIGLHNLGEGLAIGASFALGELQLGAFLIIGFMIHNVTEGLGIATPVAKTRIGILALAGLAVLAGAPAILGAWIGGLPVERRPRRALLRDRRGRRAPGGRRGQSLRRAYGTGRDSLGPRDRRLPRGDRDHVRDRRAGRIAFGNRRLTAANPGFTTTGL